MIESEHSKEMIVWLDEQGLLPDTTTKKEEGKQI